MRTVLNWLRTSGLTAAVVVGAMASHAMAGVVNVQFGSTTVYSGGTPGVQYTGGAVVGGAGDYWNFIQTFPANVANLLDSTNTTTSIGFTSSTGSFFSFENVFSFGDSGFNTTAYQNLMSGNMITTSYQEASAANFSFTGLDTSKTYDLYIYSQGDSGSSSRQMSVKIGSTTQTTTATDATASSFIKDQNYLLFSGITPDGNGMIAAKFWGAAGNFGPEGDINGLQLLEAGGGGGAVPEPTSMAIFGLGALGFAYRNRRKLVK